MRKNDVISLALKNLKVSRLRTFLTVLGLSIGAGALMAVISLGTGGKTLLDYEMTRLGVNRIWVAPTVNSGSELELSDVMALADFENGSVVSAVKTAYGRVSAGRQETSVKIVGCQTGYENISNFVQVSGRFFNARDDERSMRVAVLDAALAQSLFGSTDAVGREVTVNARRMRVIGVVSALPSGFAAQEADGVLYMPISTFLAGVASGEPDEIALRVSQDVEDAAQRIVNYLAKLHGGSFTAVTLEAETEVANRILDIFLIVVGSIAVICMLVGGTGIMNMMLSSVRERRREIGVMLAVGATPSCVFWQILAESAILSAMGSIAGVAAGVLFSLGGCSLLQMELAIPLWGVAGSLLFSVLLGAFFSIYPAMKASQISPMEAMRT